MWIFFFFIILILNVIYSFDLEYKKVGFEMFFYIDNCYCYVVFDIKVIYIFVDVVIEFVYEILLCLVIVLWLGILIINCFWKKN